MAGNPISWLDLFDFSNDQVIKGAIKDIRALARAYSDFGEKVSGTVFESLSRQQDALTASIKELSASQKELNVTNREAQKVILDNAKRVQEYEAAQEKLTASKRGARQVEEDLTKSVNGLSQSLRTQLDEYNKLDATNAQQSLKMKQLAISIAENRSQITLLTNATKTSAQVFTFAAGSYAALDAETKKLTRELLAMENGLDKNNKKANELRNIIAANTQKLKEFDVGILKFNRNVGNYASAIDNLAARSRTANMALSQVIREAPAFTFSVQTGLLAISNNIPMLVDEFRRLNSETQNFGRTLSILGKSLFSFTNILTIGISLVTIFGDEIFGAGKKADEAAKASKRYSDAIKDINRSSEASARSEITRLESLNSIATDVTLNVEQRKDAAAELQKLYPKYLGFLSQEAILSGKASKEINVLAAAITNRNRASAADRKVAQTEERLYDVELELKEARKQVDDYLKRLPSQVTAIARAKQEGVKITVQSALEILKRELSAEDYQFYVPELEKLDKNEKDLERKLKGIQNVRQKYVKEVLTLEKAVGVGITAAPDGSVAELRKQLERVNAQIELSKRGSAELAALVKQRQEIQAELDKITAKNNNKEVKDAETRIRNAKELYESLRQLEIKRAEEAFSQGDRSFESEKALQEKIYSINVLYYNKELALYKKGTKEYNDIRESLIDAETARREEILKISSRQIDAESKLQQKAAGNALNATRESFDDQVNYENEILRIANETFDKKVALYGKDSQEYEKALIAKEDAEKRYSDNIVKIKNDEYKTLKQLRDLDATAERNRKINEAEEEAAGKPDTPVNRQKLRTLRFDVDKEMLQNAIDERQLFLDTAEKQDKAYYDALREKKVFEMQLEKLVSDYKKEQAEEVRQAREAAEQAFIDFAIGAANSYFEIIGNNIDAEISRVEAQKEHEAELAGSNKTAQLKIEKNYDRELRRLRRRQSENDKDAAIFDIEIKAAMAAANALATVAFPFNIAIAALVQGLALAQIAVVNSKKIPEYWKGRAGGPEEIAMVNERGPELLEHNGKYRIVGGGAPTITRLKAGERVHTHEQSLEKIAKEYHNQKDGESFINSVLEGTRVYVQKETDDTARLAAAMSNNGLSEAKLQRAFGNAIQDIVIQQSIFDERGYNSYLQRKSGRISSQNKRNTL